MTAYDHPEYAAFIDAIRAAPGDDTPRLICADWLEERGEGEHAEMVRAAGYRAMMYDAPYDRPPAIPDIRAVWDWDRGFVTGVRLAWGHWERYGDWLCRTQPIRRVALTTQPAVNIWRHEDDSHMTTYRYYFRKRPDGGIRVQNHMVRLGRRERITEALLRHHWPSVETWELP